MGDIDADYISEAGVNRSDVLGGCLQPPPELCAEVGDGVKG
jgi:hypothetical protein